MCSKENTPVVAVRLAGAILALKQHIEVENPSRD
jgi:hypothetical protein